MPKDAKKSTPSLELTDPTGENRAKGPGSYIRQGDELVKVGGTVSPELFHNAPAAAVKHNVEVLDSNSPGDAIEDVIHEVVAAIGRVDPDNNSLWTKQSGPTMAALKDVIDIPITEDMRTVAWALFQENQEN